MRPERDRGEDPPSAGEEQRNGSRFDSNRVLRAGIGPRPVMGRLFADEHLPATARAVIEEAAANGDQDGLIERLIKIIRPEGKQNNRFQRIQGRHQTDGPARVPFLPDHRQPAGYPCIK